MADAVRALRPWLMLVGLLVAVAAMNAAQRVLVPIALAALLAFILSPLVTALERWIGRVPAVLGVMTVVFVVMGLAGWGVTRQLDGLATDLPRYRTNLIARITELRSLTRGGAVEQIQKTLETVQDQLEPAAPRPAARARAEAERPAPLTPFSLVGSVAGFLGNAGVVLTLVVFMLLERRALRDRIIRVVGHGHLALTTRAFNEAGERVARQLLLQSLVNAIYGILVGVGLFWLGVPYALVWGLLGAALRFIPYLGPLLAATVPTAVAVAALDGWQGPLTVAALFVAIELFTNLVLETVLYAGAAGVSQTALLVSVMFWTWLWGPVGLLMATPLTVCLVVLGKHVPGLQFVATLMADEPVLTPPQAFYQRLLARDTAEVLELVDRYVTTAPPRSVYDALVVPALNRAELDQLEGRLTPGDEERVVTMLRELVPEVAERVRRAERAAEVIAGAAADAVPMSVPPARLPVLAYAVNGRPDEAAADVLMAALDDLPITVEVHSRLLASEVADRALATGPSIVCLLDLPPGSPLRSRYFVRRLRALAPALRVLVARWGPPPFGDPADADLTAVGAHHVSATIEQTRGVLKAQLATVAGAGQPATEPVATNA